MQLRPYQADGVAFMVHNTHALNADEMGLGKSVQSLLAIHTLKLQHVLVLCPGYARRTWRKEIMKWLPAASFHIVEGVTDAVNYLFGELKCDIVVCNYEVLPHVLNKFVQDLVVDFPDKQAESLAYAKMKTIKFDGIIADEAHFIKNRDSVRSKIAKGIKADVRYALTGTPITSYLPEMWHILHFIDRKKFSSYWKFVQQYCDVSQDFFGHFQIEDNRADKEAVIKDFPNHIIRRLKKDHLEELPPVLFEPVYVQLTPEERKVYDQMRDLGATVVEGQMHIASVVIAQLQKLQRIAIGLSMLTERGTEPSSKMTALGDICKDKVENGESVVVFSKWSRSVVLASHEMSRRKIPFKLITGQVSQHDRDLRIDEFLTGEPSVLLATVGTAGASLNLQRGTVVVFIDKSWVPAENEQAYSRVHRMGQTEPVTVISLIAEDTVDEYVESALEHKAENISAALGDAWTEVAGLAFHSTEKAS